MNYRTSLSRTDYLTTAETSTRLGVRVEEVERMLESGELDALMPAERTHNESGAALGFDYTLLPPEGVRRVLAHRGKECDLEWDFLLGYGHAVATMSRDLIRVLESTLHTWTKATPDQGKDSACQVSERHEPPQGTKPAAPTVPSHGQGLVQEIMKRHGYTEASEVKRNVLVRKLSPSWPTLDRDLSEGYRNGLSKRARVDGRQGYWNVHDALCFADELGKLEAHPADRSALAQHWLKPSLTDSDARSRA